MNKTTGKFAGQALSAFMSALGDAAASKAVEKFTDFTKGGDYADAPGMRGVVAGMKPEMVGRCCEVWSTCCSGSCGGCSSRRRICFSQWSRAR